MNRHALDVGVNLTSAKVDQAPAPIEPMDVGIAVVAGNLRLPLQTYNPDAEASNAIGSVSSECCAPAYRQLPDWRQ